MKCKNCKNTEDRNHLVEQSPNREWLHYRIGNDKLNTYPIFTKKCKFCNCTRPEPAEAEAKP